MEIITVIPFILLLLAIAVMPFVNEKWWHKNYPYVSYVSALIIIIYYLFIKNDFGKVLLTVEEYVSFITLLFSLFVISGGIFFRLKGKATPSRNVLLLAAGSVIANIFGTTGAAMLLIRPFISSNKYRLKHYHIIFFIFTICNVGGSLTPIGDPPLFLGYIKGIPFFWIIENMFIFWFLTTIYLLIVFYIIDKYFYEKVKEELQDEIEKKGEEVKVMGLYNLISLFIIIGAVFITKPLFLRELIMLVTTIISYKLTPKDVHDKNKFSFHPIKEVAILFLGIFITMMPALQLLSNNSNQLGLKNPGDYYWLAGLLTSFLDNAPTYLNFLTVAVSTSGLSIYNTADIINFIDSNNLYIIAISVSSVFFGAMTYIGNGPNFMVKSIADHKGLKMPGFFQYMIKYSIPVLLPFYFFLWYLFFR